MGRRRIEIKKCEDQSKRYITFSKRRNGIVSKAAEFSVLFNTKFAIVISSPGEKPKYYTFGHPSADEVIESYLTNSAPSTEEDDRVKCLYDKVKEFEQELKIEKEMNQMSESEKNHFWWLEDIEKSESIEELRCYIDGLKKLKNNVTPQLDSSLTSAAENYADDDTSPSSSY